MSVYSIEQIKNLIAPVAQNYGVERVMLFGSYARGEATDESDIDLHIWCKNIRSLFELGGLMVDLEEALGKSVDIVPHDGMRKKFYENIKDDEVLLYGEIRQKH